MSAEVVQSSSLVPLQSVPAGLVRAVAPVSDVVAAQAEYHSLCVALLDDSDHQRIGRKDFRKKSAWRKLAVAFNVSCELIDHTYERDERGRIIRAEVISRATAPNGRTMDGIGACDLFEKCCAGLDGHPEDCTNKSQWHKHCRPDCSGRLHFSNPSHDLPSTAHTRATNRACADLFGMGEVSAEEIVSERAQHYDEAPQTDPITDAGWTDVAEHESHRHATDELVKALPEEARGKVREWVATHTEGYRTLWTRSQADAYAALVAKLTEGPAAEAPQETPELAPAPETPAEAPAPAPAPAVPASEAPEMDREDKIIATVSKMDLPSVKLALQGRKLETTGDAKTCRIRLAEALVADEGWTPF